MLKVRQGPRALLPTLEVGQFGFTTDTNELFIGTLDGNIHIPTNGEPIDFSSFANLEEFTSHLSEYNPHNINIDTIGVATKEQAEEGLLNNKVMTPLRVTELLEETKVVGDTNYNFNNVNGTHPRCTKDGDFLYVDLTGLEKESKIYFSVYFGGFKEEFYVVFVSDIKHTYEILIIAGAVDDTVNNPNFGMGVQRSNSSVDYIKWQTLVNHRVVYPSDLPLYNITTSGTMAQITDMRYAKYFPFAAITPLASPMGWSAFRKMDENYDALENQVFISSKGNLNWDKLAFKYNYPKGYFEAFESIKVLGDVDVLDNLSILISRVLDTDNMYPHLDTQIYDVDDMASENSSYATIPAELVGEELTFYYYFPFYDKYENANLTRVRIVDPIGANTYIDVSNVPFNSVFEKYDENYMKCSITPIEITDWFIHQVDFEGSNFTTEEQEMVQNYFNTYGETFSIYLGDDTINTPALPLIEVYEKRTINYDDVNENFEFSNSIKVLGDINFTGDLYQDGVLFSGGGDPLTTALTGLDASAGGTLAITDTILEAFGKLEYRVALNDLKSGGTASFNEITVTSDDIASVPLTVDAFIGQNVNLQEWRVDGSLVAYLGEDGDFNTSRIKGTVGQNYADIRLGTTGTIIAAGLPTVVALTVENSHASLTANLQNWKNNSGIIAFLDKDGNFDIKGDFYKDGVLFTGGGTGTVHDTPVNDDLTAAISSNWAYDHINDDDVHDIASILGLQTALDGKVDDGQVLTNVPAGALFTDTEYSLKDEDSWNENIAQWLISTGDGGIEWVTRLTYLQSIDKAMVEAVLIGEISSHTHASDNTWRGIVDDLTTGGAAVSLSAAQGVALKGMIDTINTLLLSDESTLDTLQEIVDFIELNKSTLDTLGIANISGLQTALDGKVDDAQVLTNVPAGALFTDTVYSLKDEDSWNDTVNQWLITTGDGGIEWATKPTSFPASDVYAWAKAAVKPTYNSGEILLPSITTMQWSGIDTGDTLTQALSKLDIAGYAIRNAEANVQSDWDAVAGDALILNKPTIPTVPTSHAISFITGLQTALDGKVDDAQVLTNVPAGALFTDTVYTLTKAAVEAVLTGEISSHTHAGSGTYSLKDEDSWNGTVQQWLVGTGDGGIEWAPKPTSYPASDVYAWAKASVRPTYDADDILLPSISEMQWAGIDTGDTLTQALSKLDVAGYGIRNAQKNSDILQSEIEAKLTGEISTHSHAGGSTKEYAEFYQTTAGSAFSTVETTMLLHATRINSNTGVFSLSSNQVTVNKTGVFKIDANVYITGEVNDRSEYSFWVEINGVEQTSSRSAIYVRGYGAGTTGGLSIIYSLTSGDVLQIRAIRTDDNTTDPIQRANGTRLVIVEL